MTIAHDDSNLTIQSAFICVLTEALDYETPQLAYEAYYFASVNSQRTIQAVGVKLSGLWFPRDMVTCKQLVDEIDLRVGIIGLGIEYFIETIQGKNKLLTKPDEHKLMQACRLIEAGL